MKQSKEMDQLKKVQLEHLEFLEKQNEQVFHPESVKRHGQAALGGKCRAACSDPAARASVRAAAGNGAREVGCLLLHIPSHPTRAESVLFSGRRGMWLRERGIRSHHVNRLWGL